MLTKSLALLGLIGITLFRLRHEYETAFGKMALWIDAEDSSRLCFPNHQALALAYFSSGVIDQLFVSSVEDGLLSRPHEPTPTAGSFAAEKGGRPYRHWSF